MKQNGNIKIIITHHERRGAVLRSDILCPVQTGCALAAELFPDMWHDNDGENISAQNPKYCELSAHYWAWKNQSKLGNPAFIGLMHDRRHFLFNRFLPIPNKEVTWFPQSSVYMFPPISVAYAPYVAPEVIESYFPTYDCMVLKKFNITPLNGATNMRDGFLYSAEMTHEIFDIWYDTVKELFPEYAEQLKTFAGGTHYYLCNMFVLRKDLFEEYSSFLFTVLDAVDKQIDSAGFSTKKMRFLGLLGEYTLSLFIMKLKTRPSIKLIETDGVFFMDPLNPKYKKITLYKWKSHLCGKIGQKYQKKYEQLVAEQAVLKFFK